jgi:predicted Ser/Thr protein kinase
VALVLESNRELPEVAQQILCLVRELAGRLPAPGDLTAKEVRSGSTLITLEVTAEQAQELLRLAENGKLKDLGITAAWYGDEEPDAHHPRVEVPLRGLWYARPRGQAGAEWRLGCWTPGWIRLAPGDQLRFQPGKDLADADLPTLLALAGTIPLRELDLSACERVTAAGLKEAGLQLDDLGVLDFNHADLALSPGTRIGPYEILAFLGKGGMGEVYRARNTRIGLEVALKVAREEYAGDPAWVARFRREAQLLATLNHPNIAAAHDLVEAEGAHFLVMEFVPGRSLANLLKKGRLPPGEALKLCRQVAEALEHAHERGVFHRDLKPGNVMITPDGRVKVLDYGLAKSARAVLADPGETTTGYYPQTASGVIVGTPAYLCPEQAGGEPPDVEGGPPLPTALALRDVWAFGCVLYECLAGQRAFPGSPPQAVFAAVQRDSPDWKALATPGVPPRVVELVRDCLEKAPRRRLRAIGDARREIDKALEEPNPPPSAAGRGWTGEFLLGGTTCALWPRVSPDGQWLAFAVLHEGASEVGVMKLNAGEWWVLTRNRSRGGVQSVCWSADSTHIYFDRFFDVPVGVFSVKPTDRLPQGAREVPVVDKAKSPQALADGSLVVCKLDDDGSHRLFRHRPGSPRRDEPVSPPIDFIPGWPAPVRALNKENRVVFCGKVLDGKEPAPRRRFYLLDLDTKEYEALEAPDVATDYIALAVAPDDHSVYTVLPAGDLFHLACLPLGGGGPQYLLPLTTTAFSLDVDRHGLLYIDQLHRGTEVLRFAEAGGPVLRVASSSQGYFEGLFQAVELPDGRVLLPSKVSGRDRLLAGFAGKDLVPLLEARVETAPPAAVVGGRRLAFVAGSVKERHLTVADLVDDSVRISHALEDVPGDGLRGLAASPNGETLYYVRARRVWAVPVGGGEPREVGSGDGVAVHPVSGDLIVHRLGPKGLGLYGMAPEGGAPREIEVRPVLEGLRLAPAAGCSGRAIDDKGRLLVTTTTKDSWYWRVAVLDPEGTLSPIPVDFEGDLYLPRWDKDGNVLAMGYSYKSELWRLTPRK